MKACRHFILFCVVVVIITGLFRPSVAQGITIPQEEELSREFLSVIFRYYKVINAPIVVNYINDLGQKIVSSFPPQPFKYHFYVIKEDSLNAFASPAGHIFVNSGLIEAMESEEELAGVLAHEVAHASLRHISKKIERSKKAEMATMAGVIAGVLLGVGGAGDAAGAVTMGTLAASQSSALAYSRDDESEADQVGLEYLNNAGYSAKGLLAVMKKMRREQVFDSSVIPTYMMTPGPEERMVNIDIWIAKHEHVNRSFDPYPFQRTHTWLLASFGDEKTTLKQFETDAAKHSQNALAHYGYGLSLARNDDYDKAVDQMKKALNLNAFEPYFIMDLGRIYYLAGRYPEALNILVSLESIAPDHPRRLYYLGRTQIEMGQYQDAADSLEKVIKLYPDYTWAYHVLGMSYGKMDKNGYAHYYLGIYYQRLWDLKNADFHLQKSLALMNDPVKRDNAEKMLGEIHVQRSKGRKGSHH